MGGFRLTATTYFLMQGYRDAAASIVYNRVYHPTSIQNIKTKIRIKNILKKLEAEKGIRGLSETHDLNIILEKLKFDRITKDT